MISGQKSVLSLNSTFLESKEIKITEDKIPGEYFSLKKKHFSW